MYTKFLGLTLYGCYFLTKYNLGWPTQIKIYFLLQGHEELVRCIRFDSKRIVSGAYDGKIKVWDLQAAMDPRAPAGTLCIRTLVEHSGRDFRYIYILIFKTRLWFLLL